MTNYFAMSGAVLDFQRRLLRSLESLMNRALRLEEGE